MLGFHKVMQQKQRQISLVRSNVIGTIHTQRGFTACQKLVDKLDAVEVRVDALPVPPAAENLAALPLPAILTVRHSSEGGARPLPDALRQELFLELLPQAAAVDVEAGSIKALAPVIAGAHRARRKVIVSFHDFSGTPTLKKLRTIIARARDGGADVVKIATVTETPAALAILVSVLDQSGGPLAVMGMGSLGRASRLLLAQAGSVLNYGWLDRPQVPGQWAAAEFRAILDRVAGA